jgi:hypothetical protein
MQESEDRATEAEVLVNYALLMECVQQFEWSLKTLAIHRDESMDGLTFDEAWKRALDTMRKPIGPLEGHVPKGLASKVKELRTLRNKVAHEILLLWRVETKLALTDHAAVARSMLETAQQFDDCRAKVDALADRHLRDLGIDPTAMLPGVI